MKRLSGQISAKAHKNIRVDAALAGINMPMTIEALTEFKQLVFGMNYPMEVVKGRLDKIWENAVTRAKEAKLAEAE